MNTRKIISGPEFYPIEIREGLADERRRNSLEKELEEFGDKVLFGINENKHDYNLIYCHIWYLHVHNSVFEDFKHKFRFELFGNILKYDNLINIVIMVKNAGDEFRNILTRNLPYVDRWTILDTGSTDNTVEIVKEVFKNKRGNLYEESFINFRDSRNRALELAGTDCFFNIMLDDTYVLNGNIREFLEFVRGDDVVDSYSITIDNCIDIQYISNRITKSSRGLKYINLMHEIIQSENNLNVQIPLNYGCIIDINSGYMKNRTSNRKNQDIEILKKMYEDDPNDSRTLYYLGDSYIGLQEWDKAIGYFRQRISHPNVGYRDEVQDSLYYIAVISHFYLNVEWEKCHQLFLNCYNFDQTRVESLYFIGKYYLNIGNISLGFMYLKKAFETGIPNITMSFRKNIYYYHIPFELLQHCYNQKEYLLGEKCCERILQNDPKNTSIIYWHNTFYLINKSVYNNKKQLFCDNKLVCFVSPGGWDNWDGETLSKGIGGSETFTIRYAENLIKFGYTVVVFCKTDKRKIYKGVFYESLDTYISFLNNYKIDVCIINRFPEYIPVTMFNNIEKIYYVFHDLVSNDIIFPIDSRLTGIMCISEWHKDQFCQIFPRLKDKTHVISYGIEVSDFPNKKLQRYKFIYPSFPNRGLLHLLEMFPKIVDRYPDATLDIFCDTKHSWVQKHYKKEMEQIEVLLEQQAKYVTNHGWVNRKTLNEHWSKAHIWLYPCIFHETFCLVSLEAAASKTLVITNGLAALNENTAKGIIVPGNPNEEGWQILTLNRLFNVLDNIDKNDYIQENYNWVLTKSFNIVVKDFITKYI